jgi:hypothetical protein
VAWSRCCDTRNRKGEATGNTNFDLNRRASLRPYLCGGRAMKRTSLPLLGWMAPLRHRRAKLVF